MENGNLTTEDRGSGVYAIVNILNGKKYIGSTVHFKSRLAAHLKLLRLGKHHSPALQNSWNKYGEQAFRFEIIERCSREQLLDIEQIHIDASGDLNSCPTAGSSLGRKLSDETKQKIREKAIGRKHGPRSEAYRAAMRESAKDRVIPQYVLEALQKGRRERKAPSAEERAKIGESLRAAYASGRRKREKSEAHKNAIGKAYAALSDEQVRDIRKMRQAGELVRVVAEKYGIPPPTVSAIAKRKRYRWVED